jgi:hypothetical protein
MKVIYWVLQSNFVRFIGVLAFGGIMHSYLRRTPRRTMATHDRQRLD